MGEKRRKKRGKEEIGGRTEGEKRGKRKKVAEKREKGKKEG